MKKLISLLLVVMVLALSGCKESETKELKQTILIVDSRNDWFSMDKGYYYAYKFTVQDTTNIFKDNYNTWFYSNEKWEIDDVVIVTKDDGELYFINIGNLNYEVESE